MKNSHNIPLVPEHDYVLADMTIGGDSSEQGKAKEITLCYSVVALHQTKLKELNTAIKQIIKEYVGVNNGQLEIHAKQLWNGNERMKTPFRVLNSKEKLAKFLIDLSKSIERVKPHIVVAVANLNAYPKSDQANKHFKIQLKRDLIYSAFSRLDLNVEILTGKHIGQAKFFLDHEKENIMPPREKGEPLRGYMSEIGLVPGCDPENLKFYRRIDGVYLPTDSRTQRLIQVADLSAYFVGKQLVLFSQIASQLSSYPAMTDNLYRQMLDCNFFLRIWDVLNIEVVAPVLQKQLSLPALQQPIWLRKVIDSHKPVFKIGYDMVNCSIREAVMRDGKINQDLNGTGYWAISYED